MHHHAIARTELPRHLSDSACKTNVIEQHKVGRCHCYEPHERRDKSGFTSAPPRNSCLSPVAAAELTCRAGLRRRDPGESLFGCKLVEGAEHGARQVGDSPGRSKPDAANRSPAVLEGLSAFMTIRLDAQLWGSRRRRQVRAMDVCATLVLPLPPQSVGPLRPIQHHLSSCCCLDLQETYWNSPARIGHALS